MLRISLVFLQFFCAAAIIGLVLLQRGKGAEAGAGFGAGASGTMFGARGAGTALSRATAIFTAIFMVNSLALGYLGEHTTSTPKSIFDTAGQLASHSGAPSQGTSRNAPAAGAASAGAASPSTAAPAGAASESAAGASSTASQPSRGTGAAPAAPSGH